MSISNDRRDIINGELIPAAELKVLKTLYELTGERICPELATKMDHLMSEASIYTLLNRLKKREMVDRETKMVPICGKSLKRVFWTIKEVAKNFFDEEEKRRRLEQERKF